MTNPLGTEHSVDIAVFECIIRHGIDAVTMDVVAQRMGRSRATVFRQFGSWSELVRGTYFRAARLIGWWAPRPEGDLRFELEWWWSTMMEFFASDWGRAFLAMRPHAASARGLHELECREVALMPGLSTWAGVPTSVVRSIWALTLTAACPTFDEDDRARVRELVYAMVARRAHNDDSVDDIAEFVALEAPL